MSEQHSASRHLPSTLQTYVLLEDNTSGPELPSSVLQVFEHLMLMIFDHHLRNSNLIAEPDTTTG